MENECELHACVLWTRKVCNVCLVIKGKVCNVFASYARAAYVYVRVCVCMWESIIWYDHKLKKNCIRYTTVWILMKSVSMATRPNNHLWLASLDSLEWRALHQYNSMYAMSYVYGWLWSRRVVVSSLPSASTPPSSPQFWLFDFVAAACTVRDAASPSPEGWPFYYYIMLRFSMVGRAYCKWIGHEKTLKDFNSWTQMKRNEHGRKPIYFGS